MDIPNICKWKKNGMILLLPCKESKIVGGKYLHDNRGAKIQIFGDVQNASHAV